MTDRCSGTSFVLGILAKKVKNQSDQISACVWPAAAATECAVGGCRERGGAGQWGRAPTRGGTEIPRAGWGTGAPRPPFPRCRCGRTQGDESQRRGCAVPAVRQRWRVAGGGGRDSGNVRSAGRPAVARRKGLLRCGEHKVRRTCAPSPPLHPPSSTTAPKCNQTRHADTS